jgi:predicted RNase H-like nuclease (RuvC/YqgF family)
MNGKEQRIAKLDAVQQQRKQDCLDRTEKAISKLLQNNERVSFGAIARIANVSVSYLYKYSEVKDRIQEIRDQQVKNTRKLTRPQTASEKSKQVIIQQLRERINTLEWEKKELKKQNEKMTGELYRIGTKLDLFDRVNSQAIKQVEEIKQLKLELESTKNELDICKSKLIENNPKVTSIQKKIQETNEERQLSQVNDTFSEWFKLAKDQGIVQASQGTPKGILVLESTGDWTSLETMIEKGWTLEYLQQRTER